MLKKPKIVVIGAGSAIFGLSMLKDAFSMRELWGSELVLVDIDKVAVRKVTAAAIKINDQLKAEYKISSTTDRVEALPEADFVIVSIAVDRMEMWKKDFSVPQKHGIPHVLGENVGPGAVFHTMRNLPIMLDICNDIERYCPEALLINFTNPESRLCMAIQKYTNVKAVGLCHQINTGIGIVSTLTNTDREHIDVKAWGINHFTWMVDIRDKRTGKDLYPFLIENEKTYEPAYERLSRFIFRHYGLFPTSGDGHLGEFFPFAHEMISKKGYDFDKYEKRRQKVVEVLDGIINEEITVDSNLIKPSGEKAFNIINGILNNTNELLESINLPNEGYITNLSADSIVEVPAIVSGNGVNGLALGELPRGIAALCKTQIDIQHLVVDAGVNGDRNLVLQALLTDPNIPSADAALKIYDELMEVNKPYLSQFSWE
jgi:alpha-galactosidase